MRTPLVYNTLIVDQHFPIRTEYQRTVDYMTICFKRHVYKNGHSTVMKFFETNILADTSIYKYMR